MIIHSLNLKKKLGMSRCMEADNGGAGGNSSEGSDWNGGDSDVKDKPDESDKEKKTYSQEEVNKLIENKLEDERIKMEKQKNTEIQNAKTEAEKLSKMKEDEKKEYEAQKREAELEKREKEITSRELKASAIQTLSEKGYSADLADCLVYTDAESCNKSIESVTKAFTEAVTKKVNEMLRGKKAPQGGSGKTVVSGGFISTIKENQSKR